MSTEQKRTAFRLLILITTPKLVDRGRVLLEQNGLSMMHQLYARGTASREVLDMLGLDSGEKSVLAGVVAKPAADELLRRLRRELRLGMAASGIAFTIPMTGANSRLLKMAEQMGQGHAPRDTRRITMQENEYQMIVAVVNQGFSEEVMAAARPAGAAGGTVFHSRRVGNEETVQVFGISVQAEKEAVIILAKREEKLAIMQAIGSQCGMDSPAQGIVLSVLVDCVAGLE